MRVFRALPLTVALATALPLRAQLPPLTAPKGQLRFELGTRFDFWHQGYFGGIKQDAASDFIRDPATGSWLPGLARTEADLNRVIGSSGLSLSLGKTTANLSTNVVTTGLGAGLGLTSRITVFGRVPILRVRVLENLVLDSTGATAGFNPADPRFGNADGAAATSVFLSNLTSALLSLDLQLQSNPAYDTIPGLRSQAEALLARGNTLQTDLVTLLGSSFLPLEGTTGALALIQTIDSLRSQLGAQPTAIPLPGSPALPTTGLGEGDFSNYLTNPGGPVAALPLEPPIYTALGDVEVGAAIALLNGRPPRSGFAMRSVLQGIARLRTGKLSDPNSLFDLGSGDRQPDFQGDLVTDLMTSRVGARLSLRYVVQLPGPLNRRLTPPDQPIALASTLAALERDPGEIAEGAFEPYLRIAPNFAVVLGVRHWRKAEDKYTYAAGQDSIPGTTPDVLAQGSKANGTTLSAGLTFAHGGVRQDGSLGRPFEAVLRGEMVMGSSEGRVPAKRSVMFQLRWYGKLF